MNVQNQIHEVSCDLTANSTVNTLHIPVSNTFIPFTQFSSPDTSVMRSPDDNNNKTSLPVVSVVAAMCPTISVVNMQQAAHLHNTAVTSNIIPTVVTSIPVQAAGCLSPPINMTVSNTINISNHLSLPQLQHQSIFNHKPESTSLINAVINNNITSSSPHTTQPSSGLKLPPTNPNTKISTGSPTSTSNKPTNPQPAKPTTTTSVNPKTSPTSSSQSINSDQTDELVKPVFKDGELVLEVECGQNKAVLYLSKLCQGSKGPCISFQNSWLTPNEFQFVSGRETAKDWKRSIRHHGKSLKLLLAKGILNVHPTMCDCDGCRQGATLTRKGEKRRIPNGERKSRKHSGHVGGGAEGGAARPGGATAATASFGVQGHVSVKSDLKRPGGEKVKVTDPSSHSQCFAGIAPIGKCVLPSQYVLDQRPDSLGVARHHAATTSSPPSLTTAATTSANISTTLSCPPAVLNPLTAVTSPSSHITAVHVLQPSPKFILMSARPSGITHQVLPPPHINCSPFSLSSSLSAPLTATSLAGHSTSQAGHSTSQAGHATTSQAGHATSQAGHATPSQAGHATSQAGHATTSQAGHATPQAGHATPQAGHATTTPDQPTEQPSPNINPEIPSPLLPNSSQAQTPTSISTCNPFQPPHHEDDDVGNPLSDSELSGEDTSLSNEMDNSFTSDDRSDEIDEENDDDDPDCISKASEMIDPKPEDQTNFQTYCEAISSDTGTSQEQEQPHVCRTIDNVNHSVLGDKENIENQELIRQNLVDQEHVRDYLDIEDSVRYNLDNQEHKKEAVDNQEHNGESADNQEHVRENCDSQEHIIQKWNNQEEIRDNLDNEECLNTPQSLNKHLSTEDSLVPIEHPSKINKDDSFVPIEHPSKINKDDSFVPIEHPSKIGTEDSFVPIEHPSPQLPTSAVTTLAVSSMSGSSSSNPVVLSVSTTNIKSEHIWVPPKLQPLTDNHQIHRVLHDNNNTTKMSTKTPHNNEHLKEAHTTAQQKDMYNQNASRQHKEQSSQHTKSLDGITGVTHAPKEGSVDCLTAHRNKTEARSGQHDSANRPHAHETGHAASRERSARDKEREEKYRQRVKEDRNKREKEERNRKDKEREERREREKREKNEIERSRQDEKDRKSHSEMKSGKERSVAAPSNDPYRRPPGGVADAAAFSDYMRVLAAGHGHAFMPQSPAYMSSVFRPQEPTHLLHPMAAFGPQLNPLHKDPLMYQAAAGGPLSNYASSPYGSILPLLTRSPYTTQQPILDYQRSLAAAAAAASSYPWPGTYPYFLHDMTTSTASASTSSSSTSSTTATLGAGAKRAPAKMEASVELSSKRARLEGRANDYSASWDYFSAAASQQLRMPIMSPALPCGLESASAEKTAEFLRKRYMEYWPQAAAYLSSLPEYARSAYYCACADHREEDIRMWSVEDVCKFLTTLEGCAAYVEHFREQRVNGRILCVLTPDHLVKAMGMKLGPAVVLAEAVAKKVLEIGKMASCEACRSMYFSQPVHPTVLPL